MMVNMLRNNIISNIGIYINYLSSTLNLIQYFFNDVT